MDTGTSPKREIKAIKVDFILKNTTAFFGPKVDAMAGV